MTLIRDIDPDDEPIEEEVTEMETSVATRIDNTELRVKMAAFAYHMVHSGQIFNTMDIDGGVDSGGRAELVDSLGEDAYARIMEFGSIPVIDSTQESLMSYRTQIRNSDNPNIPIITIDVSAVHSGMMLPVTAPENITLELPDEINHHRGGRNIGIAFGSWEILRTHYNSIAQCITNSPRNTMFWLQKYERLFTHVADPDLERRAEFHRIKPEWRFSNAPESAVRRFEDILHALDVGRLVKISGQVTEVGEPKVVMTHIAFRCMNNDEFGLQCGNINLVEQKEDEQGVQKPDTCPHCATQGLKPNWVKLDSSESRSESMQRLMIQEEEISGDARAIMVELRGSLCNVHLSGDTIEVTGTIRLESMTKNSNICSPYILASNYVVTNQRESELHITPRDRELIEEFHQSGDMEHRMEIMIESLAGHIHSPKDSAVDDIKKAIILQACGCPDEDLFGHRGGIRLFIVGDPGTAKTKLLKRATQLHPGSRFTTAEAASQAGLMGGCQQVEDLYTGKKRWAVIPGVIPLTHPDGVCAIDELNLYPSGEFGHFNTAMESGEIIIEKIASARIRAHCSIIAGANPKGKDANRKKFSKNNQIPYAMQIGLDYTILQRFDAIYIIEDIAEEENDYNIGLSMLSGWAPEESNGDNSNNLTLDFMQKYIATCRPRNVSLDRESIKYIAKVHAQKRKDAHDEESLISHRAVASIGRFALAAAKFDGVEVATLRHVRFAEKILEKTLQQRDPGVIDGGMSEDARSLRGRVAQEFALLVNAGFMADDHTIDEIYAEMQKNWTDIPKMDDVDKVLRAFSRADKRGTTNLYFHNNSDTYAYEGPMNPAYEWW